MLSNWFSLKDTLNSSWLAPHNHMMPLDLRSLPTTIKCVRAQWVALLIMKDDGCNVIFAKVTNPIINMAARLACIFHLPT